MNRIDIKKKATAIVMAVVLLSALPVYARPYDDEDEDYARPPREHEDDITDRRKEVMADLADELNLSEKQKEELKAKKQEHREAMKKLHEALREKKIELREELEKPDSNKKRIAFLASETKELMGKLVDINIKNILGVKEVLTPEQFEKFMDMHEAMTKKRFEFREKRKMPE